MTAMEENAEITKRTPRKFIDRRKHLHDFMEKILMSSRRICRGVPANIPEGA